MPTDMQNPCDILVVEDDEAIGQMLVETLTDEGYQVLRAEHGQAALDYLQETAILPRLILLDLMMPVMTGLEFRAVQQQHPAWRDIPVVVLSAITGRLTTDEQATLNVAAFVPKPIDWGNFERTIARWCSG